MPDFLPRSDAAFARFAETFVAAIGETAGRHPHLMTAAPTLARDHVAFIEAHRLAIDPTTRTGPAIVAKDTARRTLAASLRAATRALRGHCVGDNALLARHGLAPAIRTRTRIPRPEAPPALRVLEATGHLVRIRLGDSVVTTRRGRPPRTAMAELFTFVGDDPPNDIDCWTFAGHQTRLQHQFLFPQIASLGTLVWIAARWTNPRGQHGPLSSPLRVTLGGETTRVSSGIVTRRQAA